jgi:type II secretory pathway pseudopilin PulG
MRRFHATSRGPCSQAERRRLPEGSTLLELYFVLAISGILMLMGMVTWAGGWQALEGMKHANMAYQDANGVVNAIQEQVQRASTIQVPDPDNTGVHSIQLLVPNQLNLNTTLRRAYRLVGNNLIMEWKDEGVGPVTVFTDVTAFTATFLDAPTDSLVQLTCTCVDGTETISVSTVANMRN